MIERLALYRWRSFDNVGINFEPGTTFLVAPNGVGKTSLLLGLTWALFGDQSTVDAKSCIRLGHESAETVLTLSVSSGRLMIRRTVNRSGKATAEYTMGDQPMSASAAEELLAEDFGAPLEIASRLAVIRGTGKDDGELQLREHLYNAFGITGLRQAAAQAKRFNTQATAARKKLRAASRTQLSNRDQLRALADQLQTEVDELRGNRAALADALDFALQMRQAARNWEIYDSQVAAQGAQVQDLLDEAGARGLSAPNLSALGRVVTTAIETASAARDDVQRAIVEAEAQAFAARSAIDLLAGHDPSCPTCARPFHSDELDQAIAAQGASLTIANERIETGRATFERLKIELTTLVELKRRVAELSMPVPPPSSPRPVSDPESQVRSAQQLLQAHDEQAGSVTARRAAAVNELNDDAEVQAAYEAERRAAWQREALTQAAVQSLERTAERLATEQIEPISNQVRWRWKALFGEDGLQLRPDGSIVRAAGDRELPWSQLSSGEQIWARLVASLLVLRASTTIPFAWLDEPLEHLDPRARRIVASDIANATRSGRPAQMIVTTYEHTLVRQLAEDLPATHVRYINHWAEPPGVTRAERYRDKVSSERHLTTADENAIDDLLRPQ